jgi:hypothetical protein
VQSSWFQLFTASFVSKITDFCAIHFVYFRKKLIELNKRIGEFLDENRLETGPVRTACANGGSDLNPDPPII